MKARRRLENEDALLQEAASHAGRALQLITKALEIYTQIRDAHVGLQSSTRSEVSIHTHPFVVTIDGQSAYETQPQVESLLTDNRSDLVAFVPRGLLYVKSVPRRIPRTNKILQLDRSLFNVVVHAMRDPAEPFGHLAISTSDGGRMKPRSLSSLVSRLRGQLRDVGVMNDLLPKARVGDSQSTTPWGYTLDHRMRYAIVEDRSVDSHTDTAASSTDS